MPFAIVEPLTSNFGDFASAFWITLRLVLFSFGIAMASGIVVAALRIAPNRGLQWAGAVYVEFFRNIPLLVLLLITFPGFRRAGIEVNAWVSGVGSLGLYTGAYVAEVLRSGVFSVSKGQVEAAQSLGMVYREILRRIILPQAIRTVISPLGSVIIAMVKNSAIIGASILALEDLLKTARLINAVEGDTVPLFIWAGVGYLLITVTVTIAVRRLELRFAISR